jgi:MoxR-like ATPase
MTDKTQAVLQEVKKVIIGKDDIVTKVFMSILSQGSILLDDVPGVGKTTLALAFRKVLGLTYRRVQFTPDSVPSDIAGFSVYDRETGEFEYKPGAAMTNLLLADEINRTSSKTQAALLEVMEEGNVTVDGVTREVPKPFIVIATQNPVGSAGTQLLPHSQLDRFMIRLEMGYPDFKSQVDILRDRHTENPLDATRQVTAAEEILRMQEDAARVHIADEIYEYVARLAQSTREHALIQLGLSPRGALAVCRMAKARAFVNGRDYVVPEDVAAVFGDVCSHRIVLYPKAKITQSTAAQILQEVVKDMPMPGIKSTGKRN